MTTVREHRVANPPDPTPGEVQEALTYAEHTYMHTTDLGAVLRVERYIERLRSELHRARQREANREKAKLYRQRKAAERAEKTA